MDLRATMASCIRVRERAAFGSEKADLKRTLRRLPHDARRTGDCRLTGLLRPAMPIFPFCAHRRWRPWLELAASRSRRSNPCDISPSGDRLLIC